MGSLQAHTDIKQVKALSLPFGEGYYDMYTETIRDLAERPPSSCSLRSKEVKSRGVGDIGRPVTWNHIPGREGLLGG